MKRQSQGDGHFRRENFRSIEDDVVIESEVLVFHPEGISLASGVYVGHRSILKGYHKNEMKIGEGTWIGQECFFHSAGGIDIGKNVGVGPHVKILTSLHEEAGRDKAILHSPLRFSKVRIEDDADIGIASIVLPGVTIGRGAQVGAGSIVTKDVAPYAVVAGNPARLLRMRDQ